EPFPEFATQTDPKPTASATGSVPTTTSRTIRLEPGAVATSLFRSRSTVQTKPAPRATGGWYGAFPPGMLRSVASVRGSSTSSESAATARGLPPVTNLRSSAVATPPRTKRTSAASSRRPRVSLVGCRATPLADAVFDGGDATPPRLLHHRGELRDQLQRLALLDEPLELGELLFEPGGVDRRPGDGEDLRVRRRGDGLSLAPQLLVQLLPGANADELDRDVAVRLLAGEADHLSGELEDRDRLAHVEDEHLAGAPDRAGLHDQRDRLRDRHEVARHLRVGDADRPAPLDLAAEDRDHAAAGAEHVAEPDGDEAGRDVRARPVRLDDPLAERLRLAHHRLRVDRLVRRDEHEPLDAEIDGDLGDHLRRQRVVADRLERVRLHQGDVLVGGRVEDDPGRVPLEHAPHPLAVACVGEHGHARGEAALRDELALDLEQRRLALVDEDQPLAADPCDLAGELGADRAAGAGDEHGRVAQVGGDRRQVDLDGLPPEDVLDLDGADLAGEVEVAGDQLVDPRQGLHR